MFIAHVI